MTTEGLRKWNEVSWRVLRGDEYPPALILGTDSHQLVMPLAAADDGKGEQIISWRTATLGLPCDVVCYVLPGMCGHFDCGATSPGRENVTTFSLN